MAEDFETDEDRAAFLHEDDGGKLATYTAPNSSSEVEVWVFFRRELTPSDSAFEGHVHEPLLIVEFQNVELVSPRVGGEIVIDGVTYLLSSPIDDDGHFSQWIVKTVT